MTHSHLQEIRSWLDAQLARLESERYDLEVESCADENEFASQVAEAHIKVAVRERVSQQVREIQTALRRLDSTDFGCCEECGCEIGVARLKARPTATLCVDCQTERESQAAGF
ncbi:TraR/DksA family transcriptional regulator [Megalodesulfovibrio paquesii]